MKKKEDKQKIRRNGKKNEMKRWERPRKVLIKTANKMAENMGYTWKINMKTSNERYIPITAYVVYYASLVSDDSSNS